MVKRYSTDTEAFDDKHGLYVLYADYAALLEAAKELLRLAIDPKSRGYIDRKANRIRHGEDIIRDARALIEGREPT